MELLILGSTAIVGIVWASLAAYLLVIERRRATARRLVARALTALGSEALLALPLNERVDAVRRDLDQCTREMLMHAAADGATPVDSFDVLAAYMVERWAGGLERDAAAHHTARDKWRRITAFRILFRLDHPATLWLLARGIEEQDTELADAGLGLLGQSSDSRAMDILIEALKRQKHPAALVASHIEQSPLLISSRLCALLHDPDPVMRFWGATLLARYPDKPIEAELAPLANDQDPRVRKAALQTLGAVGGEAAVGCARARLDDPVAFVRAHAARALGGLGAIEHADAIARLLGDVDWWTRLAARESLESLGTDVWPVLVRCLADSDRFVRNGAAEVIQNLGVLDSLIVMEAASDSPAPSKVDLLRRIAAAGGVRFTDALVERHGERMRSRILALLNTIGLQHVEAA